MLVKEKRENCSARVCLSCFKMIQKKNQEDKKEKNKLTFACFVLSPRGNTGVGAMSLIFRK